MGAFYTFAPWRFAVDLRAVSVHLLFFALALNWVGDSAAYYVGRQFGKHKLAPRRQPRQELGRCHCIGSGGGVFRASLPWPFRAANPAGGR